MNKPLEIPQYRQIAHTLRRRILDGVYREGEVLPTAADLEASFGVSNITVRKALALLAEEGCVEGRRGIGTVVTGTAPTERVTIAVSSNFREWFEAASGKRLAIEQSVIDVGLVAPVPRVARALGLDLDPSPAPRLWRMRRLRRIAGAPVSFHVNYGRPEQLDAIDAARMAASRNFIDVMRDDLGFAIARIAQTIEAIIADRDLAAHLAVPFGDPLFFVENVYYSPTDTPLAVSHLYLRADRYAYAAEIRLDEGA